MAVDGELNASACNRVILRAERCSVSIVISKVNNSMNSGSPLLRMIPALVFALIVAGCSSSQNDDQSGELWSPFNDQSAWDVGDGRIRVEVSGHERGHQPGRSAEFTVDVENLRDEPADLTVCAKLIDEHQVVQEFSGERLQIEPNQSDLAVIQASLDETIEPGAYGFAVVVGEIGFVVHTIRVGIPDDEPAAWLDVNELGCN